MGRGEEGQENLYSGRVAFSSSQAVVTLQTLVWPASNNFVVKDKKNTSEKKFMDGMGCPGGR